MNDRIWNRLHNDRSARDREIQKINRLREEVERREAASLSQKTSERLRSTREPNAAVLNRARLRHVERMAASMYLQRTFDHFIA